MIGFRREAGASPCTWTSQFFILPLVLGALLFGCASKTLTKIDAKDLPSDLSKELRDKFEIREAVASPSPVPAVQAQASQLTQTPPEGTADKRDSGKTGKKHKKNPKTAKAVEEKRAQASIPAKDEVVETKAVFKFPNRRPAKDPIWLGEKLVYDISYFGMSAGDFTLEVLPYKEINQRKVYHVRGVAVSSKVFSLFYRLHDTIESFIDYEGLFSHRFNLILDESKQTRNSLELNDTEKGQTYYWNRWNHYKKGYIENKQFYPMQAFSQDSLSALFYLRTLPLPNGAVLSFPVISEGKNWEAVVTVIRREEISSPMGKVRAIVVKPETKYQGILQKSGDSFIWLTDDDRRFVVRLEAKVRIGTVVAKLREVSLGESSVGGQPPVTEGALK